MTIHIRSLPRDVRARVISHRVFRTALLAARIGVDRPLLDLYANALQDHARACVKDAQACLLLRRCRPDTGLVTRWGEARSDALRALAAACGRTLIVRRIQSLAAGADAIRALERELASYSIDEPWAQPHPLGPTAPSVPASALA